VPQLVVDDVVRARRLAAETGDGVPERDEVAGRARDLGLQREVEAHDQRVGRAGVTQRGHEVVEIVVHVPVQVHLVEPGVVGQEPEVVGGHRHDGRVEHIVDAERGRAQRRTRQQARELELRERITWIGRVDAAHGVGDPGVHVEHVASHRVHDRTPR